MNEEEFQRRDGRTILDALRVKVKLLSPRRAREFRDRANKRWFGSRKQRAERWAYLVREYGLPTAIYLSRSGSRQGMTMEQATLEAHQAVMDDR